MPIRSPGKDQPPQNASPTLLLGLQIGPRACARTDNLNLRISTHTLPTNPARLVLQCAEVAAVELRAVGVVAGGAAARQAGGEQEVGCTPCADGRENI